MGLSTHVLDTMHGTPAVGMGVALYVTNGDEATLVKRFNLNADGRNPDRPLLDAAGMAVGRYRLLFEVAPYFCAWGLTGWCLTWPAISRPVGSACPSRIS